MKKNCRYASDPARKLAHVKTPEPLQDDHGMGTLEIVILIAALLALALIFNRQIQSFASSIFQKVFNGGSILNQIGGY
ncbi:MAG: Flp1 family type IVb pilin [Oscillospiraceae bacterium]|nr:Flp1 family type IVb pilin [Oscillospiraceae bacterium]MDD4367906.1 Flp1 family type IVb pilin [Oscillospiraceae bacterium]